MLDIGASARGGPVTPVYSPGSRLPFCLDEAVQPPERPVSVDVHPAPWPEPGMRALEVAENEGWPMRERRRRPRARDAAPAAGRRSDAVARRSGPAGDGSRRLDLEQLLAELVQARAVGEAELADLHALIAQVAVDLALARQWPIAGCGPGSSRQFVVWRARYEDVGAHLPH